MSETFTLPYAQSHLYFRGLFYCLGEAERRYALKHTRLMDISEMIASAEDQTLVAYDSDKLPHIAEFKQQHASEIPALQRNIVLYGDSGLPTKEFLRDFSRFDAEANLSDLVGKLGDTRLQPAPNEKQVLDAVQKAISEGRDPLPYRQILMWIHLRESVGTLKDLLNGQVVGASVSRNGRNSYTIQYGGLNYLRGGADVTSLIQTGIKRRVKVRNYKMKFSKPVLHRTKGDKVEVDKRLLETLQPVIGQDSEDVMLVLRAFKKADQELAPTTVIVERVGPFLFSGNVAYHEFSRYLEENGVVTREKLLEVNPEAFLIASIAEQIKKDPRLFALIVLKTQSSVIHGEKESVGTTKTVQLYMHRNVIISEHGLPMTVIRVGETA